MLGTGKAVRKCPPSSLLTGPCCSLDAEMIISSMLGTRKALQKLSALEHTSAVLCCPLEAKTFLCSMLGTERQCVCVSVNLGVPYNKYARERKIGPKVSTLQYFTRVLCCQFKAKIAVQEYAVDSKSGAQVPTFKCFAAVLCFPLNARNRLECTRDGE